MFKVFSGGPNPRILVYLCQTAAMIGFVQVIEKKLGIYLDGINTRPREESVTRVNDFLVGVQSRTYL